jgi:hypothetical protein
LSLFKVVVDYEKGLVFVRYVRKLVYGKEQVEVMKGRVNGLREKLKGFVKKIDLLLISE